MSIKLCQQIQVTSSNLNSPIEHCQSWPSDTSSANNSFRSPPMLTRPSQNWRLPNDSCHCWVGCEKEMARMPHLRCWDSGWWKAELGWTSIRFRRCWSFGSLGVLVSEGGFLEVDRMTCLWVQWRRDVGCALFFAEDELWMLKVNKLSWGDRWKSLSSNVQELENGVMWWWDFKNCYCTLIFDST